jgi:hypothetical protein
MINLEGADNADKVIRKELAIAKVPGVLELPCYMRSNVSTRIIAVFDHGGHRYLLWRAWNYWVVDGRVPMTVALRLYADSECRADIRAGGHSESKPPGTQARWFVGDTLVLSSESRNKLNALHVATDGYIVSDTPQFLDGAYQTVECYDIDSQLGLCRFIELLLAPEAS